MISCFILKKLILCNCLMLTLIILFGILILLMVVANLNDILRALGYL